MCIMAATNRWACQHAAAALLIRADQLAAGTLPVPRALPAAAAGQIISAAILSAEKLLFVPQITTGALNRSVIRASSSSAYRVGT